MIALFVKRDGNFNEFTIYPKKEVIRIKSMEDIRDRTFTAVILFFDWFVSDPKITEAYEELKQRQPELFQ